MPNENLTLLEAMRAVGGPFMVRRWLNALSFEVTYNQVKLWADRGHIPGRWEYAIDSLIAKHGETHPGLIKLRDFIFTPDSPTPYKKDPESYPNPKLYALIKRGGGPTKLAKAITDNVNYQPEWAVSRQKIHSWIQAGAIDLKPIRGWFKRHYHATDEELGVIE